MKKLYYIISVIAILWVMVSYVEIISKNLDENPNYSEANILVNIFEEANKND